MSRWLPSGDARRSRTVDRALLLAGLVCLGICGRAFLGRARGQGVPQPVPTPTDQRLHLLGGVFPRGARVTLWTQAGHDFTGRLQAVSGEESEGYVLLERAKDCLRIRRAFVYAAAGGGR